MLGLDFFFSDDYAGQPPLPRISTANHIHQIIKTRLRYSCCTYNLGTGTGFPGKELETCPHQNGNTCHLTYQIVSSKPISAKGCLQPKYVQVPQC